jgi:hypothetical protein
MLCWAFNANFTNASRRTTEESSFHDMPVEWPRNEVKSVNHVYANCVTHVCAPCLLGGLQHVLKLAVFGVWLFELPCRS